MIRFACPECGAMLAAPPEKVGASARCRQCGNPVTVPAAPPLPPAADLQFAPTSERERKTEKEAELNADGPLEIPAEGCGRRAAFVAELRALYDGLRIISADEYLHALGDYFDRRRVHVTERQLSFRTDLRKVYSLIAPPYSEHHLQKLAVQFDSCRQKTKDRLRHYLESLPRNDPLRCPISLFGAMHCGRLETAHTYLLAWLLDPAKEHGFGAHLLESLLEHLSMNGIGKPLKVEKIQPEFPIEDGRIDVMGQGKWSGAEGRSAGWLLVIEAKVDADEGEQQLAKYDKWIRKRGHGREVFRVFLTAEGRQPETSEEDWKPMSFLQLACIFRNAYKRLEHQPGHQLLQYYLAGVLKHICHWSLPVQDAESCTDPYGFVQYLKSVKRLDAERTHP
jgi:hypothetical protein